MDRQSLSGKPLVLKQGGGFLCVYCARSGAEPYQPSLCPQCQCLRCDKVSRIPFQEIREIERACRTCHDYTNQVRLEPGSVEDKAAEQAAKKAKQILKQLDTDNDGFLTSQELQVAGDGDSDKARELLDNGDQNQDSKLSPEEFTRLIN